MTKIPVTRKPSKKSIAVAKKLITLGIISALMSACSASCEGITEQDRQDLTALIEREVN